MRLSQTTTLLFFLYITAGAIPPIHGNTGMYHRRNLVARDVPPNASPGRKPATWQQMRAAGNGEEGATHHDGQGPNVHELQVATDETYKKAQEMKLNKQKWEGRVREWEEEQQRRRQRQRERLARQRQEAATRQRLEEEERQRDERRRQQNMRTTRFLPPPPL